MPVKIVQNAVLKSSNLDRLVFKGKPSKSFENYTVFLIDVLIQHCVIFSQIASFFTNKIIFLEIYTFQHAKST